MKNSAFEKMNENKKIKNLTAMIKFNTKGKLTDEEVKNIVSKLNPNIQYKISTFELNGSLKQITYNYNLQKNYNGGHEYKNIVSSAIHLNDKEVWNITKHEDLKEAYFKMETLRVDNIKNPMIIHREIEYSKMIGNENVFYVKNELHFYIPSVESYFIAG
jgi:ribosomal protein L15